MASVAVKFEDLGKELRKRLTVDVQKSVITTIQNSLQLHGPRLIQEEISLLQPHQPVSSGRYKGSWNVRNIEHGAVLYNSLSYPPFIEYGRRAGARFPPVAALIRWVRHKGLAKGVADAHGLAFVIARKIAKKGIPPKPVMGNAIKRFYPILIAEIKAKVFT